MRQHRLSKIKSSGVGAVAPVSVVAGWPVSAGFATLMSANNLAVGLHALGQHEAARHREAGTSQQHQALYYKENYPKLQQVKRRWDPLDIFNHAQSIE